MRCPSRSISTRYTPCRLRRPASAIDRPGDRGVVLDDQLEGELARVGVGVLAGRAALGQQQRRHERASPRRSPGRRAGPPCADLEEAHRPASPASSSSPETTRLVDVPISVTVPPTHRGEADRHQVARRRAAGAAGPGHDRAGSPSRRSACCSGTPRTAAVGTHDAGERARARRARARPARAANAMRPASVSIDPGARGGGRHDVERGDGQRRRVREAGERVVGVDDARSRAATPSRRGPRTPGRRGRRPAPRAPRGSRRA